MEYIILGILLVMFFLIAPLETLFILVLVGGFKVFAADIKLYKYKGGLEILAPDYKTAAQKCFLSLTNGQYPGEERGLDIIDICVNPIKGENK